MSRAQALGRRGLWLVMAAFVLIAWLAPARAADEAPAQPLRLASLVSVAQRIGELAPDQRRWLAARKVLRVGVVADAFVPYDLAGLNGDYKGISADYIQAVASTLGLEVTVLAYATPDLARGALLAGDVDVLPTLPATPGGDGLVPTAPYARFGRVVATSPGGQLSSPADLKVVGYVPGHVTVESLGQAFPRAQLRPFATTFLGLAALNDNRLQAFVGLDSSISYLIDHYGLTNQNLVSFEQDPAGSMHFGFASANAALAQLFDRVLANLPPYVETDIASRWSPNRGVHMRDGRTSFTAAEQAWIEANPVVRWQPEDRFMPFVFRDYRDRYVGLSLQVLAKVAAVSGLRFEMAAPDEHAQIDPAAVYGQELAADMRLSQPYFRDHWVLVGRADGEDVTRLDMLAGRRLAYFEPSLLAEMLASRIPGMTLVRVDSVAAGYEAVAAGRADFTVGNIDAANYIVRQFYPLRLKVAGSVEDAPVDIAFGVSAASPLLLSIINKSLDALPAQELRQIRANGMLFSRPATDWARYAGWAAFAAAILLVGLAVFALWTRSLRRQVERRRKAEAELRDQLEFQRAMLEGMPHAVSVRDSQARLLYCNLAFEHLLNRSRVDMLGRTMAESPRAEDRREVVELAQAVHARYLALLAGGSDINEDVDLPIDGTDRRLLHWATPIALAPGGPRVALVAGAVDLTERQQMLELLEAARARAEAANRAKTSFLATMSHEIRTPMNAVMGVLELLLREGRLGETDHASVELARRSAHGLLGLIDDLLDISKIEAGALEMSPEPAQLALAVREVANVFASLAHQRGLDIAVSIDPALRPWHRVDPLRFRQIVNNLVSNAIKYTDAGGVRVSLASRGVADGEEQIELEVSDTGIGISPEDVKLLFKPFFQAEAAGARTAGGTGLGLPIVQRLSVRMGGDVRVSSQPGQGTTIHVTLRLPVSDEAEAHAGHIAHEEQPKAAFHWAVRGRHTVLAVDDHPGNRLLIERQLGFLGYRCVLAEDGRAALARWRAGGIDAVITDCSMPVLDGYGLTHEIRQAERASGAPRTPVLGCTAHVQERDRRRAIDVGMDECLLKPMSVDELQEALRRYLPDVDVDVEPPQASDATGLAAAPPPQQQQAIGEVFDARLLRDFSGGHAATEIAFLQALVDANAKDLVALEQHVARHALGEAGSVAHRIRGAARIVRADPVEQACLRLEAAAREDNAAGAAQALNALRVALARFDAAMLRHIENHGVAAHH